MNLVGFSTGCLYKQKMNFVNKIKFIKEIGANAIEIGLATVEILFNFTATKEIKKLLKDFEYLSIHAPFVDFKHANDLEGKKVIKKLKDLCKNLRVNAIVVHPDNIADFKIWEKSKLPVAIENMEKGRKFGGKVKDIKKIKDNYNFYFVLDLQHAYENDHSMKNVKKFIKIMDDKIKHLHVSGENKELNHSPITKSINKEKILKAIKTLPKVPIISEGVLINNIKNVAKKDFALLNSTQD